MALSRKEKRQIRPGRARGERLQRPRRHDEPGSSHVYEQTSSDSDDDVAAPPSAIALREDVLLRLDAGTLILKRRPQILDSAYEKAVQPRLSVLRKYQNGTGNIYGELLEPLIDDIIYQAQITSTDLFVDLGSGYGNVVLQMALKTGCKARGIELREELFPIAQAFRKEVRKQTKQALHPCDRCGLLQGDFLESKEVDDWIENADVLFTNNVKFDPSTNSQLADKLASMKDGARIVFLHDWIEIRSNSDQFEHEVREYEEESVSWTAKGGQYYIATVVEDRNETKETRRNLRKRSKSV